MKLSDADDKAKDKMQDMKNKAKEIGEKAKDDMTNMRDAGREDREWRDNFWYGEQDLNGEDD